MFLYVILFNSKMPMQVLFQIANTGIHHIRAPDDLIVFIVFYQFGVIFKYLE